MKALPDPEPEPGEIWWNTAGGHMGYAVSIRSLRQPLLPYYRVITADGRVQLTKLEEMRRASDQEAEQYRKHRRADIEARKREQEMHREMRSWGRE